MPTGKGGTVQRAVFSAGAGTANAGKSHGKGGKDTDRKCRTVYFGNFPEDTKGDLIKQHIDEWTAAHKESIEET